MAMKVFVAEGTGVLGRASVRALTEADVLTLERLKPTFWTGFAATGATRPAPGWPRRPAAPELHHHHRPRSAECLPASGGRLGPSVRVRQPVPLHGSEE